MKGNLVQASTSKGNVEEAYTSKEINGAKEMRRKIAVKKDCVCARELIELSRQN